MMHRLQIPSLFRGFEVLEFLEAGLSGEVYRARGKDNRMVALKVFDQEKEHDSTVFGHFSNEQHLLREISWRQHPHIVEYVDSDFRQSPFFLATRYIEGARALRTLLGMPLHPGFVLRVVEQIGSALDCLHYGHSVHSPIVHRDVNPRNVLIDADGNAVLIDLSIASSPTYKSRDNHVMGTSEYMAPEQHNGAEMPETDQFALATLAFQMLVGYDLLPNDHRAAMTRIEELRDSQYAEVRRLLGKRKHTADVIIRALMFEPRQRYASCEEFAYELRLALIRDGYPVDPVGPPMRSTAEYLGYLAIAVFCLVVAEVVLLTFLAA